MHQIKKIGIATSSSNIVNSKERLRRAIEVLERMQYKVELGSLASESYYYAAGTIEKRIEEINCFISSDIDAIMFSIGGLTSVSLLDGIDYKQIVKRKIIFIGNSDITAILLAVYSKTNLPVIYFQTILPAFGELGWALSENIKFFQRIIDSELNYKYTMPDFWTDDWKNWLDFTSEKEKKKNKWRVLNKGNAKGTLVGGNLQTIVKLLGSEYLPNFSGSILFLEDTSVTAEMTEAAIYSLKNSRVLDNIVGLIVGKCENYNSQGMAEGYGEWVAHLIGKKDIPVVCDFDCGHTYPCLPLIIGKEYCLDLIDECNINITLINRNTDEEKI